MADKKHLIMLFATTAGAALLAGCVSNQTQLGGGSSEVTGSAGAAGTSTQGTTLTKCARPIGTAALVENPIPGLAQHGLTSPVPMIRLMMAQSRCFQVVDRGQASAALERERALAARGELRTGSNMGLGQMAAADFLITPHIIFQDADSGGGFGGLGGLLPGAAGALAGGLRTTNMEAQVMLTATNVRTGIQEAVAEGRARKTDIDFGGLGVLGPVAGLGGAYENTDIGKIVTAAFMDAHNKLAYQMGASTPVSQRQEGGTFRAVTALNMRSGPTTRAPVVTQIPSGASVVPTGGTNGPWWEVEYEGTAGWVHSDYLVR